MSEGIKINMKFGNGAEFNAEGPEDLVREAFAAFLQEAEKLSSHPGAASDQADNGGRTKDGEARRDRPLPSRDESPNEALLDRVFRVEGEVISLRAMPNTEKAEADALLLLLYGYARIKSQHDVTALQLGQAAKQTGIQADRLDRLISQNAEYRVRSGFKKGVRYGLNNPGIRRSEELMSTLLG